MSKWLKTELGQLMSKKGYIRGPFGSSLKRGELLEFGIPVYEQKNVIYNNRQFRFFIDEQKFAKLKRFQVQTNDLIISCSGTVGKISIIKEGDLKGIISQALLILRPNTSKIELKFLYYFLSSRIGFELITQVSQGSVQVNIAPRASVEKILIPTPPLPEQNAIARDLVQAIRNNVTIDWTMKQGVRAKLRVTVKRLLKKYGYPPDKQEKATVTVLQQAELLFKDWIS
jgi:type I restriction enzyme, S subunit